MADELPYDKRINNLREIRRNIIKHYTKGVERQMTDLWKITCMIDHKKNDESDKSLDNYIFALEKSINDFQTDLMVNKQRLDKAKSQKERAKRVNATDEQDLDDYYSREPSSCQIDG